jgi:hypothetical protein
LHKLGDALVVVADGELSAETFRDLKMMHQERIATGAPKWAKELEGSYRRI